MEINNISRIENGIEAIIAEEIKQIHQQSVAELKTIESEYKQKADEYEKSSNAAFEQEGQLKLREMVTAKKMFHKKQILMKKREIVDAVFEEVIEALKSLQPKDYIDFMLTIIQTIVISTKEEIHISSLEKNINKKVIDKLNADKKWKLVFKGVDKSLREGIVLREKEYETVLDWNNIKEFIKLKYEDMVIRELFDDISI